MHFSSETRLIDNALEGCLFGHQNVGACGKHHHASAGSSATRHAVLKKIDARSRCLIIEAADFKLNRMNEEDISNPSLTQALIIKASRFPASNFFLSLHSHSSSILRSLALLAFEFLQSFHTKQP